MKSNYTILAIDTSCDETSVAVTVDDRVVSNVVFSQVAIHKKWGGVVPLLAKRAHEEKIDVVVNEALIRFSRFKIKDLRLQKKNNISDTIDSVQDKKCINPQSEIINQVDAIAVTIGPGLAPALEVGIGKAKEVAREYSKPLIAVNHMEGHLLSPFAKNAKGKGAKIADIMNRRYQSERSLLELYPLSTIEVDIENFTGTQVLQCIDKAYNNCAYRLWSV